MANSFAEFIEKNGNAPSGRLISIYWLFVNRRVAEATPHVKSLDDMRFCEQLFADSEVARFENQPMYVTIEDWRRVLSLIPEVEARQPMTQLDAKALQQNKTADPVVTDGSNVVPIKSAN